MMVAAGNSVVIIKPSGRPPNEERHDDSSGLPLAWTRVASRLPRGQGVVEKYGTSRPSPSDSRRARRAALARLARASPVV